MNKNLQKVERVISSGSALAVHSVFATIQGEGIYAGCPAIFVRLAGCNLQCPLCDTEYTNTRVEYSVPAMMELVREQTSPIPKLVVITGGEPFRQPIGAFSRALLDAGFKVQVETNGTLYREDVPYEHPRFSIMCSPKLHTVHPELIPHITAFKYVAQAGDICRLDGLPLSALEHPNKHKLFRPDPFEWDGEIFLQPVDEQDAEKNDANLRAVVSSCLRHGHRLCLQIHKLIGVP